MGPPTSLVATAQGTETVAVNLRRFARTRECNVWIELGCFVVLLVAHHGLSACEIVNFDGLDGYLRNVCLCNR
jgi:hypothetical protein